MVTRLFVCLLRLDNQHVLLMRFRLASAADRVLYSAVVECGLERSMLYCLEHGIPDGAGRPPHARPIFSTDMLASRLRWCLRMFYSPCMGHASGAGGAGGGSSGQSEGWAGQRGACRVLPFGAPYMWSLDTVIHEQEKMMHVQVAVQGRAFDVGTPSLR